MSLSYVSVYFKNIALAEICSKGVLTAPCCISITVSPRDGVVEMKADLEGSGVNMPGNGIPNRGSASKWFAQLLKQFGSEDLEVDGTENLWSDIVREIDEKAAEIDEQLECAELILQRNDPTDCTFNSHYEQVYLDKRTAKITGMDYYSWEELWESHDIEEFEQFLDSNKLGIEAYSPWEYPFWLLLAEGWAEKTAKNGFFRRMMEYYGTKTIQVGKYAIKELEQKKEQLFEKISNRFVDPRTIDFTGKIVAGVHHSAGYCAPILQESQKTAGLKKWHLFDRQILRYGGRPTQSLSSNSDYYVIARNVETWFIRAPYKDTDTPEDLEIERYQRYMDHSRFIFGDLDKYDAMRIRRGKKPVQFISEDEFNKWLLDTYPPCDEETLRSEDNSWLHLRNNVMSAVEKLGRNAQKTDVETCVQEVRTTHEIELALTKEQETKNADKTKNAKKTGRAGYIEKQLSAIKDQCEATGKKYPTIWHFYNDARIRALKVQWLEEYRRKYIQQNLEDYLIENGIVMTETERMLS